MRRFIAAVLVLGIAFLAVPDALAGKGGGGGRSFSSGSSGRSSFSGGGKPSYSSGSRPSFSGGGKPSYSSPGSKPASKPTYSSGRSSTSTAPKPLVYKPGSSYSSGGRTYTPAPHEGPRPKGGAFDGNAAAAQRRAESKSSYIRGPEPRPTYTTPTGRTANIDANSRPVQTIRSMDHHLYVTREVRIHSVYAPYYGYPVVVYHDPFNTFFWYWMLDQSLERRAMWAYHHRAEMDEARYRALLAKDAGLEARIRQLEAEKRAVDPTYVPPGIDYDLQYTDDYVDGIVNPHTVNKSGGWWGSLCLWSFLILLGLVVTWLVVYLVFKKRW